MLRTWAMDRAAYEALPAPFPRSPRARYGMRVEDVRSWLPGLRESGWRGLPRATAMVEELARRVARLPDEGPALVPVHGDPQRGNWLLAGGRRLYQLDWDTARLDDPVTDPARLAWWLLSAADCPAFLAACGLDPDDSTTRQRADLSVLNYVVATAVYVVRFGRLERADHWLALAEELLAS